ncbi:MAG: hypothetical protein QOJ02_1124 [Acidobacteriota bacterium]|jgi:hypothetical protein|nr:hypothetical protein [Acidobacteriota bacterium]
MREQSRLIMSVLFMFVLLAVGLSAFAQGAPPPEKSAPKSGEVFVYEREVAVPQQGPGIRVPAPPGDDTVIFVSSEMSFDGKVVKGAPYAAQAITETTRTLSDGNRIKRKTTASVYRDSEGRTRRDQELGVVGPWAMSGDPQQTVFINDPVAGVNYVLDPRTHIARKMPPLRIGFAPSESSNAAPGDAPRANIRIEKDVVTAIATAPSPGEGAQVQEFHLSPGAQKGTTESLGKETIEGVVAEGTRTTMTIPVGEVGNEQPLQIVWERWYSPELQTVVMSKHSDPFVGETVYRLTNIVRSEPARTLFEVPVDYTIKEFPMNMRFMRKRSGEEK